MDGTAALCVGLGVEKVAYVDDDDDLVSSAFMEDILISGSLPTMQRK